MRRSVLFLAALFIYALVSGQAFEGKITYTNTYKSKSPKMTDQQWNGLMGTTQEYSIKDGNYRSVVNGSFMQWQLYRVKENKLYNKMANSPTVFWNDASVNKDEVLKTTLTKDAVEILGYKCDELVLTCKSGIQVFYFSSAIPVDASLFQHHLLGNWYAYLSKANALPLKTIITNEQFSMESVATEVKSMKLDDQLFELPAGAKTEKSPY